MKFINGIFFVEIFQEIDMPGRCRKI